MRNGEDGQGYIHADCVVNGVGREDNNTIVATTKRSKIDWLCAVSFNRTEPLQENLVNCIESCMEFEDQMSFVLDISEIVDYEMICV